MVEPVGASLPLHDFPIGCGVCIYAMQCVASLYYIRYRSVEYTSSIYFESASRSICIHIIYSMIMYDTSNSIINQIYYCVWWFLDLISFIRLCSPLITSSLLHLPNWSPKRSMLRHPVIGRGLYEVHWTVATLKYDTCLFVVLYSRNSPISIYFWMNMKVYGFVWK